MAAPASNRVSADKWLEFLTKCYVKNVRNCEDYTWIVGNTNEEKDIDIRILTPRNLIIYPNLTDEHKFMCCIKTRLGDITSVPIQYKDETITLNNISTKSYTLNDLEKYLHLIFWPTPNGIRDPEAANDILARIRTTYKEFSLFPHSRIQQGGRKRRSRKSRHNKV